MALQEVARRVLLGHWMVIAGLVIACMAGVTVLHLREAPTYTASTRLVLDAPAPTSLTEATAIADGAKAIVTSPSHVSTALDRKSTRLNSSHSSISYAVFCLKKKKKK